VFCPECGEKQQPRKKAQTQILFCPECGTPVKDGDLFCEECGFHLAGYENTDKPKPPSPPEYKKQPPTNNRKKKKSGSGLGTSILIGIIAVLAILLVAGLVMLGIKVLVIDKRSESTQTYVSTQSDSDAQEEASKSGETVQSEEAENAKAEKDSSEAAEAEETEANTDIVENPSEDQITDVDYNLFTDRKAVLSGVITENNGKRVLQLDDTVSVYGAGSAGKAVLLSRVVFVGFNTKNAQVSAEDLKAVADNTAVTVSGNLSIIDNQAYIFPDSLTQGGEETAVSQNTESTQNTDASQNEEDSEFIFADSATRYLTDADVQNMTAQQLNYAKNEIYARRGRKFSSPELQKYFSSKSWYSGTISPDAFSESVFNAYEKANIDFLKAKEYALSPGGYPLDQ
jgi:hypothetical protein